MTYNYCASFIVPSLKCLGRFEYTTISLCSYQKLYPKIAFCITLTAKRMLPWSGAISTVLVPSMVMLLIYRYMGIVCFFTSFPGDGYTIAFILVFKYSQHDLCLYLTSLASHLSCSWMAYQCSSWISSTLAWKPCDKKSFRMCSLSILPLFFLRFYNEVGEHLREMNILWSWASFLRRVHTKVHPFNLKECSRLHIFFS